MLLPGVDVNICNEERESVTQIPCMKLLLFINEACSLALSTYTFPYVHMHILVCICTYALKITCPNKQNYLSKYIKDKVPLLYSPTFRTEQCDCLSQENPNF